MFWDVIIAPVPANSQLKYYAEVNENGTTVPFSGCGNAISGLYTLCAAASGPVR